MRTLTIFTFYMNYIIVEIRLVNLKLKNQSIYLHLSFKHIIKSISQRIKQHSKPFLYLPLSWQMFLSNEILNAIFSAATWFSRKLLSTPTEIWAKILHSAFNLAAFILFQDFPICQFIGFRLSPFYKSSFVHWQLHSKLNPK